MSIVTGALYSNYSSLTRLCGDLIIDRYELLTSVLQSIQLSTAFELINPIKHGITRMDIDKHQQNFLLSGYDNGSVVLYNFANLVNGGTFNPIARLSKHQGVISNVQWYPNDNGACITSSLDGKVFVWDANCFEVAGQFDLKDKVYCSSIRNDMALNLIAAGTSDQAVRLCDLNSGSYSHTLRHSSAVYCMDWSPQSAYLLATGSMDGGVRVWDIRKSGYGPIVSLDWQQDFSQLTARSTSVPSMPAHASQQHYFPRMEDSKGMVAKAHTSSVLGVKYSSCGNFLVTCGRDKHIRCWNSNDGGLCSISYEQPCLRNALPFQMDLVNMLSDSGSGNSEDIFICPGENNTILMYPLFSSDGVALNVLEGHVNPVRSVVMRNNGMYQIFSGSSDGMLLAWDPYNTSKNGMAARKRQDEDDEKQWQQRSIAQQSRTRSGNGLSGSNAMLYAAASEHAAFHKTTQPTIVGSNTPMKRSINPLTDDNWSDDEADDQASGGTGRAVNEVTKNNRWIARAPVLVTQGGLLQSRYETAPANVVNSNSSSNNNSSGNSDVLTSVSLLAALDNLPSFLQPQTNQSSRNPTSSSEISTNNQHTNVGVGGKSINIVKSGKQLMLANRNNIPFKLHMNVHPNQSTPLISTPIHAQDVPLGTTSVNGGINQASLRLTDAEMMQRIDHVQKRRKFEKKDAITIMKSQMFPDQYR